MADPSYIEQEILKILGQIYPYIVLLYGQWFYFCQREIEGNVSSLCKWQEESIAGGLKIAGFAGKKLKSSNCEQIGGFSDK